MGQWTNTGRCGDEGGAKKAGCAGRARWSGTPRAQPCHRRPARSYALKEQSPPSLRAVATRTPISVP